MDVSIIIVNYNSFDLLDQCLVSIEKFSTEINYEIIIVDNNSTEGNVGTVTNKYSNIKLIKNSENAGFGKANNQGLEIAEGNYVLVLNPDTIFIENSLSKILDYAKSNSGDFFIQCKLNNVDGSFQNSAYKFPSLWRIISSNFFLEKIFSFSDLFNKYYVNISSSEGPKIVDSFHGAFIFSKLETLRKLKGFDERIYFYHEDTDLCYRLKKLGGRSIYYPHTSIIHIGGAIFNTMKWFQMKNKHIARIQFFQNHFSYTSTLFLILIQNIGNILRIPILILTGVVTLNKKLIIKSGYFLKLLTIYPKNKFK